MLTVDLQLLQNDPKPLTLGPWYNIQKVLNASSIIINVLNPI